LRATAAGSLENMTAGTAGNKSPTTAPAYARFCNTNRTKEVVCKNQTTGRVIMLWRHLSPREPLANDRAKEFRYPKPARQLRSLGLGSFERSSREHRMSSCKKCGVDDKPNFVTRTAFAARVAAISLRRAVANALKRPTCPLRPDQSRPQRAPGRLGLARGGVCHAPTVTRRAVRSYRTFSPLPVPRQAGPSAVCFLWHCPWPRGRWVLPTTVS